MFKHVVQTLKRRRSSEGLTPVAKKLKTVPTDWTKQRKVHKTKRILSQLFEKMELMVKSANGTLYSAIERGSRRPVCIKQIDKTKTKNFKRIDSVLIPDEIYFHFRAFEASPRFVIQPLQWLEFTGYYVIVMERPLGWEDLFEVSRKHGALSERLSLTILTQAVHCARDLFNAGICHRDIKDENILVDLDTARMKLIDFGSATDIKPSYTDARGTPEYWPPEFYLERRQHAEELTVWSLGCVYYIMLTGGWKFAKPIYKPNLEKEARLSTNSRALLRALLCPNPTQRCKFSQLTLKNI